MQSLYVVGQVADVGQGANYSCELGYFFGEDKDMVNYSVPCLANGTWDEPAVWPECFHPSSKAAVLTSDSELT